MWVGLDGAREKSIGALITSAHYKNRSLCVQRSLANETEERETQKARECVAASGVKVNGVCLGQ